MLLTVTVVPFWVLMESSAGFYGTGSSALIDNGSGDLLLIQPYAPDTVQSWSFAAILQQPAYDDLDLSSKMWVMKQSVPRDVLIFSAPPSCSSTACGSHARSQLDGSCCARPCTHLVSQPSPLAVMGWMDLIAVLVMWLMHRTWKKKCQQYVQEYDESVVDISDYTVFVTGMLPYVDAACKRQPLLVRSC